MYCYLGCVCLFVCLVGFYRKSKHIFIYAWSDCLCLFYLLLFVVIPFHLIRTSLISFFRQMYQSILVEYLFSVLVTIIQRKKSEEERERAEIKAKIGKKTRQNEANESVSHDLEIHCDMRSRLHKINRRISPFRSVQCRRVGYFLFDSLHMKQMMIAIYGNVEMLTSDSSWTLNRNDPFGPICSRNEEKKKTNPIKCFCFDCVHTRLECGLFRVNPKNNSER